MSLIKEALYYSKLEDGKIKCYLCPFECRIDDGVVARCMGRGNIGGKFYATNYGKTVSFAIDPIEKKPLFHFHPGSRILSIAGNSCNLGCVFCQNWSISQTISATHNVSSEDVLVYANKNSSVGVAYTYSEPLMWYEFLLDTAKLIKRAGLYNVLITNATINKEPLEALIPYIDAINIDLKGIQSRFYKKVCKGLLSPVLDNIKLIKDSKSSPHLEITNLLIPGLNDTDEDIKALVDFISEVDKDIPLHFSAYHPQYKLDIPKTPIDTLRKAYLLGRAKLNYVYLGNVSIDHASTSYCPSCASELIVRDIYKTSIIGLKNGRCLECNEKIAITV